MVVSGWLAEISGAKGGECCVLWKVVGSGWKVVTNGWVMSTDSGKCQVVLVSSRMVEMHILMVVSDCEMVISGSVVDDGWGIMFSNGVDWYTVLVMSAGWEVMLSGWVVAIRR